MYIFIFINYQLFINLFYIRIKMKDFKKTKLYKLHEINKIASYKNHFIPQAFLHFSDSYFKLFDKVS